MQTMLTAKNPYFYSEKDKRLTSSGVCLTPEPGGRFFTPSLCEASFGHPRESKPTRRRLCGANLNIQVLARSVNYVDASLFL